MQGSGINNTNSAQSAQGAASTARTGSARRKQTQPRRIIHTTDAPLTGSARRKQTNPQRMAPSTSAVSATPPPAKRARIDSAQASTSRAQLAMPTSQPLAQPLPSSSPMALMAQSYKSNILPSRRGYFSPEQLNQLERLCQNPVPLQQQKQQYLSELPELYSKKAAVKFVVRMSTLINPDERRFFTQSEIVNLVNERYPNHPNRLITRTLTNWLAPFRTVIFEQRNAILSGTITEQERELQAQRFKQEVLRLQSLHHAEAASAPPPTPQQQPQSILASSRPALSVSQSQAASSSALHTPLLHGLLTASQAVSTSATRTSNALSLDNEQPAPLPSSSLARPQFSAPQRGLMTNEALQQALNLSISQLSFLQRQQTQVLPPQILQRRINMLEQQIAQIRQQLAQRAPDTSQTKKEGSEQ